MKVTGDDYFDSAEFHELLDTYEQAVSTGQPVFMDTDELVEIADYYQYMGRCDEAEEAITLAQSLSPGAIAPLTYRIHEALSHNDTEKAWELLDQIIETNDPDFIYNQAEILIVEERIDEADNYLREEFKNVPPEEYQDFVVDVANIYSEYGYPGKAMEWMARAKYEDTPDFKELMGRTLFGLGKYKDSERIFNELIDTNPFSRKYWNALASAQFMNEDYDKSVQSSEYAIAIDPEDPDGLIAKANGLYRLNNNEGALEYYKRYLKQEPDDELAMLYEAICLINLGQRDEAITILNEALKVADGDASIRCDIYQELAFAYSEKKEPEKAIEMLNQTENLDCDHIQMEVIKGHVMLAASRMDEAQCYFQGALKKSDNAQQTMLRIIVSFYDNRYIEIAYKLFKGYFGYYDQSGLELDAESYAYMALCCHDLGHEDEFLAYMKKACEKDADESRQILGILFPEDMKPEDYYSYYKDKVQQ